MGLDDLYKFKSFGPAPPRKPLPGRFRKSRPSEEMVELARELASALRQTPGPSPAQLKTSAKKKPKAVKQPSRRDEQIYSVIEKELKGRRYVTALDRAGVRILESWRKNGCPDTYPKAYDADEHWRTLIRREKYRIRKRYRRIQKRPSIPLRDKIVVPSNPHK